jgi:hypothetical protein
MVNLKKIAYFLLCALQRAQLFELHLLDFLLWPTGLSACRKASLLSVRLSL